MWAAFVQSFSNGRCTLTSTVSRAADPVMKFLGFSELFSILQSALGLNLLEWPGHVGSGFKSFLLVDCLSDSGMIDFQHFQ